MRKEREKSVQMGHIILSGGSVPETINNLSNEEIKKNLETFQGTKTLDIVNESRPRDEKDYKLSRRTSSPNMLQRKVSLVFKNEEPQKPPPTILTEGSQ